MKYHPKEIYYVVKDGFASIVLDYGEHKTIHQIFAAQHSVQRTAIAWSSVTFFVGLFIGWFVFGG